MKGKMLWGMTMKKTQRPKDHLTGAAWVNNPDIMTSIQRKKSVNASVQILNLFFFVKKSKQTIFYLPNHTYFYLSSEIYADTRNLSNRICDIILSSGCDKAKY